MDALDGVDHQNHQLDDLRPADDRADQGGVSRTVDQRHVQLREARGLQVRRGGGEKGGESQVQSDAALLGLGTLRPASDQALAASQ